VRGPAWVRVRCAARRGGAGAARGARLGCGCVARPGPARGAGAARFDVGAHHARGWQRQRRPVAREACVGARNIVPRARRDAAASCLARMMMQCGWFGVVRLVMRDAAGW